MFDAARFNLSFIDDALSYIMIEDFFTDTIHGMLSRVF
jgi:hypothetical protein